MPRCIEELGMELAGLKPGQWLPVSGDELKIITQRSKTDPEWVRKMWVRPNADSVLDRYLALAVFSAP
jgi:hypothetical protein